MLTIETNVICPFCAEQFSIVIDCSEEHQIYTEDCSVCCKPIQFNVQCTDGEFLSAEAHRDA
jgi:hypothetical protein